MNVEFKASGKSLAAAGAIFLGVVLALATTIARGTGSGPLNAPSLVQTIVKEEDHVTPGELARWIIEKRTDYQLIDIRDPWQFDDYHIPTAVNIPLSQLFEEAGLKQLSRGKKIVLYGLGAGHAAQAQLLLSLKGYKAYSLREGLSAWWDEIMTPTCIRSEDQPSGYRQTKELREHFTGSSAPRSGSFQAPPISAMPPTPSPAAPRKSRKKEKEKLNLGRGCS